MKEIILKKHDIRYAEQISNITSKNEIKDALGLKDSMVTVEGARHFIEFIIQEEKDNKQFSRVIFTKDNTLIGVITLKDLNFETQSSHIGTWISPDFWGKGYNTIAKYEMLDIGFNHLKLEKIFAGAKCSNIRSIKAQEKLPYITLDVGYKYRTHLKMVEETTNEKILLNVVYRKDFNLYKSELYFETFKDKHNMDTEIPAKAWKFGDTPDTLAEMVINGEKTATSSLYKEYKATNFPLPKVGQYDIILNSTYHPVAIIQKTSVEYKTMSDVTEQFAIDEGDESLENWWEIHEKYFTELAKSFGLTFSLDDKIVCEYFKVVDIY